MKSSVLLVAVVLVAASLAFYVYYDNMSKPVKLQTGSHVYLGAQYIGPEKEVNYVSALINFSRGSNLNRNVYYVVLSIWDSNTSYDQVGVASIAGRFYSTYSYTDVVNGSIHYVFNAHWFPISSGLHSVSMSVASGNVTFSFDQRTQTNFTGGDYFIARQSYQNSMIGNGSYSDLTVYEEIYGFDYQLPGISYNFSKIEIESPGFAPQSITDWAKFSHNLTSNFTSTVFIIKGTVNIYNMPSYSLNLVINDVQYSGSIIVSDINLPVNVSSHDYYSFNLLPGNYTLFLTFQNQSKTVTRSYNITEKNETTNFSITI